MLNMKKNFRLETRKQKIMLEIVAGLAALLAGTLMGEGDVVRNLISGVVSAVVVVLVTEWLVKIKKGNEVEKND